MIDRNVIISPLVELLDDIGKEIVLIYKQQSPVDTGALKRSIVHRISHNGDSVTLTFGYLSYGLYTDLGTGRYSDKSSYGVGPFDLPQWNRNPGRGRMGIRPRYWSSLNGIKGKDLEQYIQDMFGASIADIVDIISTQTQNLT